ncbi:MAG: methylenetetrahydrofolate reductase [Thermodesulfovibrio sp.]|nr:methylenetetrahydrofolate reductase [Thermodesulfovibrio sp.]
MNGDFVFTVEITPPKGPDITSMRNKLEELKELVDAANFTDNPSANMRLCSMAACKISLDLDFEPVLQMACRDRNRIGIQSDLLGAYAIGIRNLLLMTGDHPVLGDHKEAKPVYDIDSSVLVKLVNNLNNGLDINGNRLNGRTDFFYGAVVNPNAEPLMPQLKRFEQKLKMGAEFFQTQMIFEIEKLERFMDYSKKFNTKVIAGVVIIRTKKMLHYIAEKIPGVVVPKWLINEVEKLKDHDVERFGLDLAASLIINMKEKKLCDGVHIMAFSRVQEVRNIINLIKNRV